MDTKVVTLDSVFSSIQKGRLSKPPRIVLYGMEGIGKSSFASRFPTPIFIQTEDGLSQLDCARFPLSKNENDVVEKLDALAYGNHDFKTVVIDSLDWLERLIWDEVCSENKVENIEKIGFARGYTYALTHWRKILEQLTTLRERGMIVLLLAHAIAEDYNDPEVAGLKRFTPRLHKTARSLIAEYVDAVFLATRKFGAAKGDVNNPRIIRTDASPYQVAKSRYSIPAELPLDADAVLTAIKNSEAQQ